MKLYDLVEVLCIDLSNLGMGVAKIDRFPFFIENILPGERAKVEITELKSKYGFARVVERLNDSLERIHPICPYFEECGGCQLMHLKNQDEFKKSQVERILKREISPLVKSPQNFAYRNKMVFQGDQNKLGLYEGRSNTIVDIDYCYLQSELMNNILVFIRDNFSNVSSVTIRGEDEILVNLNGDIKNPEKLFNHFKEIKSLYVNQQHKLGNEKISIKLNELDFSFGLESFFQVNTQQTEFLYRKIVKLAQFEKHERVLDLYCGVGSIALSLAKHVEKIIGVDINEQAILDANTNKINNQINNVDFVQQDSTDFLNNFKEPIDTIIVDPPRKGLTQQGINDILLTKANKLIYVSCNPMTLKRDLDLLSSLYKIIEVVPFDMFPQTYHVECITLLTRK